MKYLIIFLLLCLCCQTNSDTLIPLLKFHQQTKENFSIQDTYKLIYQGVFGVAHILENPDVAKQYLAKEMNTIEGINSEQLVEIISVSGDMVRINLRPFKKSGGSVEKLFEIMTRSAEETRGDMEKFLNQWGEFKQAVIQGKLNFNIQELEKFDNKVKAENYPAVHHSPGYRKANRPAYRVVKKRIFLEYFPNLR